jgi:lipopolysaccharide export system permease protein
MSILFAVLLTYSRLSKDSEIIALKSLGMHQGHITLPAIFLGIVVVALSAQTSFSLAPWGNRQFEVVITKLSSNKPGVAIREGTFSEGFFNMVVYANSVDSATGNMQHIFIYDERDHQTPLTIIAKSGQIVREHLESAEHVLLRLKNGSIHKTGTNRYTKVDFGTYDINLARDFALIDGEKSPQSMSMDELRYQINHQTSGPEFSRTLEIEYHKRWAIAFVCLIFALLGASLGTERNPRQMKSGGFIISMIVIVAYWVLFVTFESFGKSGNLPPAVVAWAPNGVFSIAAIWSFVKNWS